MKFSLGGDQGLSVLVPGYPKSQDMTCGSNAPVDAVEETITAGQSSLSYTGGEYTYVWKTESSWSSASSQCRQLVFKFIDGSTRRANFKFTK